MMLEGGIYGFFGEYRFLSNFWPAIVAYEGELYGSVEHAYQAAKTNDLTERGHIQKAATAALAKKWGKKVTLRSDWELIKLDVMYQLVRQKFFTYDDLREKLLATGNRYLEESNTWGDCFWGVCNGKGHNHLGRILSNVREELRAASSEVERFPDTEEVVGSTPTQHTRQALVVNLFAGPGSGKSTTASGLFYELKNAGVNVELTGEFAKDLVWSERQKTLLDQFYVFGKQHHRVWRLADKVDVVITDSPILLGIAYSDNYPQSFKDAVVWAFNQYNNINFLLNRTKKYNPAGRNQTEDESDQVHQKIKSLLIDNKVPYTEVDGNREGLQIILNQITDLIG